MSRRPARFTQIDLIRAGLVAASLRQRTGEPWRVRVEPDGAIVLEPFEKPAADPWAPQPVDRRREIDLI